jgi:hypothetical protein
MHYTTPHYVVLWLVSLSVMMSVISGGRSVLHDVSLHGRQRLQRAGAAVVFVFVFFW